MGQKVYFGLTAIIFGAVFCLHIFRLFFGWQVVAAGWTVPMWFSWGGLVGSGALCLWAVRLASKK